MKIFFAILCLCSLPVAGMEVEKLLNGKQEVNGYVIATDFFKAIMIDPGKAENSETAANAFRGGWFKNIILNNSDKGLLGKSKSAGDFRFGLTQLFEPEMSAAELGTLKALPGIGKLESRPDGQLKVAGYFPWKTTVEKSADGKTVTLSYAQTATLSDDFSYKLRIDCIFSASAKVKIKGIFFNNGKKEFSARVSPFPVFEIPYGKTPWVTVPHQDARKVDSRRISYINTDPIPVNKIQPYYEFIGNRLSKLKSWVAAGGLAGDGVFAFDTSARVEKVVFWRSTDCFSVYPAIKIKAEPDKRVEWEWTLIFGRGLKQVSLFTKAGLFGIGTEPLPGGKRFDCNVEFMPVESQKGLIMDLSLKTLSGKLIQQKSIQLLNISPLKPSTLSIKLPQRVKSGEKYNVLMELFDNNDDLMLTAHDVIFP